MHFILTWIITLNARKNKKHVEAVNNHEVPLESKTRLRLIKTLKWMSWWKGCGVIAMEWATLTEASWIDAREKYMHELRLNAPLQLLWMIYGQPWKCESCKEKKRNEREKPHLISESECFFALTLHPFTLEILITVTHFIPLHFVNSVNLHF